MSAARFPVACEPVPDGCAVVVFAWSTEHGPCADCGLPAAFYRMGPADVLCAVCAANAAADGDPVARIDAPDGRPMVASAAWLADDCETVGIEDRDGRYYVIDRETYRAARAAADPGAVPVPAAALRVPFDPFAAADMTDGPTGPDDDTGRVTT